MPPPIQKKRKKKRIDALRNLLSKLSYPPPTPPPTNTHTHTPHTRKYSGNTPPQEGRNNNNLKNRVEISSIEKNEQKYSFKVFQNKWWQKYQNLGILYSTLLTLHFTHLQNREEKKHCEKWGGGRNMVLSPDYLRLPPPHILIHPTPTHH